MRKLLILLLLLPLTGCTDPPEPIECQATPAGYSKAMEIQVKYPSNIPDSWPELSEGRVTMYENDTAKKVGYLDNMGCTWINAQSGTYWLLAEIPMGNCALTNGTEVMYDGAAMRVNITGLSHIC